MLSHGDELGRTQQGNNNTYCQDNELTWVDWQDADQELIAFTRSVAALRRDHPTFRRRRFFNGRPVRRKDQPPLPDIAWLRPDGSEMTEEDWDSGFGRAISVFLNGQGITGSDERGERITDDSFLLCFSAHHEPIEFKVPDSEDGPWRTVLDTAVLDQDEVAARSPLDSAVISVAARSVVVLRRDG